jgi:hypothetical protein
METVLFSIKISFLLLDEANYTVFSPTVSDLYLVTSLINDAKHLPTASENSQVLTMQPGLCQI